MMGNTDRPRPRLPLPGEHQRGAAKTARIPVKIVPREQVLPKPPWIRVRLPAHSAAERVKQVLRQHGLHTVCEEASCPNLPECFGHGTATFMIMGDICTRRCPFCDVAHGRPLPLNPQEPQSLARTIQLMKLRYVVITSVDRDDLPDGGAAHFAACIRAVRAGNPGIRVEILVPDFRKRVQCALESLSTDLPDVFNHNLETVPRLYKQVRPGAQYEGSLRLIEQFKQRHPHVPTKSGLMVGVGEELDEVRGVMRDLREHRCDMLTIGQYLAPSRHHLPVARYVTPTEFEDLARAARALGFTSVASGPLVRSSYHADQQAAAIVA
jgi:lipoic acid synthetase